MRTSAQFLLTLILLTAASVALHAAELSPPLGSNPNFTRLMMDADKTVGEVLAIRQDKYGFIWIGGKTGLARYDGYRFKIFVNNSKDEHSLSANFIRDLFEDSHGRLWIASENGGMMLYNRDMENFDRIGYTNGSFPGRRGEVFYRIMEDTQHRIWFAGNRGVSVYDETQHKITQHLINSPLDNYLVYGLVQMSEEEFAIATSGGMFQWNRRTDELLQLKHVEGNPHSLANDEVRDILLDSYHNVWVATDKGISRFRPATKDFDNIIIPNANPRIAGTPVWSLYEDNKRMLWLATDGNGVMYFDPATRKMGSYSSGAS
ncbi:MAG TPA: two-component regulator propeller domain-containing protein, partial [Steroidobacteraceae bacterium]|nr:two-component regulator propeller domain-containing protein [Steroidobacteraceae bacterium]